VVSHVRWRGRCGVSGVGVVRWSGCGVSCKVEGWVWCTCMVCHVR
jgi:hypothetical protein